MANINTTFNTQKEYKYWEEIIQQKNKELFDSIIVEKDEEVKNNLVLLYKAGQDLYANLMANEVTFIEETTKAENKKIVKAIGIIGSKLIRGAKDAD